MKDKLQLLIKSEANITRSGFAEMLGIQPATISHILAGRNKPSYELLQKILLRFPNVSSDWLMLDRGEMLRDASLTPSGIPRQGGGPTTADELPLSDSAGDLFAGSQTFQTPAPQMSPNTQSGGLPEISTSRESHISADAGLSAIPAHSRTGSPVERVVVFYADKTFETYTPKN